MKPKMQRRLAIGALTLAVAGVGSGYALAAGGSSSASAAAKAARNGPGPHGGIGPAVASYLGLTEADLRAQRDAGKSLAQIAAAQAKTVAGLETAIYDAAKADLDGAVSAGRITSSEEAGRLAELRLHLDDIVNRTGPPPGPGIGGPPGAIGSAVASYLGLTEAQLRA
jgi:hypothetical protein